VTCTQQHFVAVAMRLDNARRLPEIEATAYYIAAEAAANAIKHANAGHVTITLARTPGRLQLTITDDGAGGAAFGAGTGLQGIRDRADAAGGRLTLASPVGGPTIVTAELRIPARPLRLVLADDAALIRQELAELLDRAGMHVVAQAGNAPSLLNVIHEHQPDVATIDIRMPPTQTTEGIHTALQIRQQFPAVGILLLSIYIQIDEAIELFTAASRVGHLLKDSVADLDELTGTLTRISEGGTVFDSKLVAELLGSTRRTDPLDALTPRERQGLALMAEGNPMPGSPRPSG
jgi:DNA-binding NarL/FixJ family response regulator